MKKIVKNQEELNDIPKEYEGTIYIVGKVINITDEHSKATIIVSKGGVVGDVWKGGVVEDVSKGGEVRDVWKGGVVWYVREGGVVGDVWKGGVVEDVSKGGVVGYK